MPPSFLHQFFRLAIVNILSNLMVPLAGLLDVAFLGHLAEIQHLAGVALATVLFNYLYWTFGFLRMGTTGMTAQAVGRNDEEAVILIGLRNGILALLLGMLMLIFQQPLRTIGFTLLSASAEVKQSGQAYYDALIWGAPATLLNFVLVGWFLGRGQGTPVLLLSLVNNGVKVLLDYLLIVQWGWQSAGAGLATAVSQGLMLLVGLILVRREIAFTQVRSLLGNLYDPVAVRSIFNLNRDIVIRTFALVSTFAAFTTLSSNLGTVVLVSNTVLLQVVTLSAYFVDGLAFATESMAGLVRGRNTIAALSTLLRVSGIASLAVGLTIAGLFILLPGPLFRLLTSHTGVLGQLNAYVGWLLPVLGFGSIAYMLDGYFLGLTEGRVLRQSSLVSAAIGFAPVAIVAWQLGSIHLLWLALSLFMATRAATLAMQVPKTLQEPLQDPL